MAGNQGLTILGLGANLREAADGREVASGVEDLHQQRL